MVLERIISVSEALRHPLWMFVIGGIISVICLFIALFMFPESVGLFMTFLITIAMMPFMVKLITYEEETTEREVKENIDLGFIRRHLDILTIYAAFFAGMIFFLSIVYLLLPEAIVEQLFQDQIDQINIIRGSAIFADTLQRIVFNNVGVLILSFVLSFLFGAGAIFILAWNASILATAIGLTAKAIGGVASLPLAVLVYFPHGSLEILAYFIGAIAGGLISAAIMKRSSPSSWLVTRDSLIFIGIAIIILVVAGFVESASITITS